MLNLEILIPTICGPMILAVVVQQFNLLASLLYKKEQSKTPFWLLKFNSIKKFVSYSISKTPNWNYASLQ